ncbi:MAG TPA: metallophosphoesterase family protein [Myxococcota bacterium]|nr:metallophosphoesterase family protein [Myxococcota bacterium]
MWIGLLVGCLSPTEPAHDPPVEADTPAEAATPYACEVGYSVPGALGSLDPRVPDAHALVFGEPREVAAGVRVGPDPVHVHLGYPSSDAARSLSVVWQTDPDTRATAIEWGVGAMDHSAEGVSFTLGDDPTYRTHEIRLCGALEPDTTYSYRVGAEGHWSPVYQFTTPPAPGPEARFTLAMTGDSRGSYEEWAMVVARMEAHDPDLVLFSGDMVSSGASDGEWYAWWEAAGDVFARKVVLPAHGNHEILAASYFANFSLPGNEQWYSVDYASMTLVSLNDTVSDYPEFLQDDQVAFLHERLGASAAPWKVAMHHQAMFTACDQHRSRTDLRGWWTPELDEHGVDLVLAGHNHIYERSVPIRAEAKVDPGQGAVYVVAGGAGAPLYPKFTPDWFTDVVQTTEHYLIAEFGPDAIVVTVRDLDDNVIDSFEIPAG